VKRGILEVLEKEIEYAAPSTSLEMVLDSFDFYLLLNCSTFFPTGDKCMEKDVKLI
jgi:hypothetical protein